MSHFAKIETGRERWSSYACIARHRHDRAYVAVVLSGTYEECGSRGRFRVGPGDVLVHDTFDAHLNRFQKHGAQILNLVSADLQAGFGVGHVADPDEIARTAERDAIEAMQQLQAQLHLTTQSARDWTDDLALDLLANPSCRLEHWAREHGLSAETVSRGFGKVFGITPASFRLEARTCRALALIRESPMPLAAIALATGFADQAHMSRAVSTIAGSAPRKWRSPAGTGQVRSRLPWAAPVKF
jgi:AraC-like DNA-binding protein